ncbi:MAG: glycosyltransferase family 39 protein [Acidobacteria bacterium]|jgi:hypothetical protein|nr:glycosyltransferase family 39 protein [Acidobacteriota bacterium]
MPADKRKWIGILALSLLLAVALGLRLQGWNRVQLPDEDVMVQMTLHLYDLPFPDGAYPGYPGFPPLFIYFNLLLSFILQKLLLFFGIIRFPAEFLHAELGRDLILKGGRIVTALTGTALVALSWRCGQEFFNRAVGTAAALLMAVSVPLVFDAHIFKPDTLMALLLFASLYFALKHDRDARPRWLVLSSLVFGLAVAAKYNAAVEALFLLPAFLIACRRQRRPLWQPLLLAPAAMALGFLAGAPNWIVHPWRNIEEAYRFVTYHYSAFHFYEKKLVYSAFFKTMVEAFGPVLFAFLLVGLLAVFLRRQRAGILIAAYLFVYVAILGNTSYFGTRMVLPLLPAVALLITHGLLAGVPWLLDRCQRLRLPYRAAVWMLLAYVATAGLLANVRRFNLLNTAATYDQAIDYRFRHVPFAYSFARENFTPGYAGDKGFSDLVSLPARWFRGPEAMPFLCTGLFTEYILTRTTNPLPRANLQRRLANYAAFARIHKPRFSSFDDDVVFWYKKPGWVRELNLARPLAQLKPLFSLPPGELPSDTCFLPLTNFERSPLAGRTAGGIWTKKIHSTRPLARLAFHVLADADCRELTVNVNGRSLRIAPVPARRLRTVVVDRLAPRPLHHDFIYSLEIIARGTGAPVHLACIPEYTSPPEPVRESAAFDRPQDEPLPELFAPVAAPSWCREFYRLSGIDPILHRFVQTQRLFENEARSVADVVVENYPLPAGRYLLRLKGESLGAKVAPGSALKLTWSAVGLNNGASGEFVIAPEELASGSVRPFAVDELAFVRFAIAGQAAAGMLVGEFSIEPDYLAYINSCWLKK